MSGAEPWICEKCGEPSETRICRKCKPIPPSGTEWTEPGQGATPNQLMDACQGQTNQGIGIGDAIYREAANLMDRGMKGWHRTNIRLIGAPLTAEDVKRIAEAK